MCGICGKVALGREQRVDPLIVKRMARTLAHRGPDDEGMHVDPQAVLGHTRLSIIDLNTGQQPICNEDRTVWVVYNGEIYNFRELRHELTARGHVFSTATDTEVLVHLYEEYGSEFISKLSGMFAFALWDSKEKVLLLARDRVGIKPLYYCLTRDCLLFASEIKALLVDPATAREIDPQGIDHFLTFFYMPGDKTLFRHIWKLDPGHYLVLKDGRVQIHQYWDLQFRTEKRNGSLRALTTELVELLGETVRNHMISDVPVGVLLSGGVDSTAMLSFAASQSDEEVRTFTIGFQDEQFPDERPYARLAARAFGTKHYEMTISAKDFADFLPAYVWHMEEPVFEPPAVALYYVTKLAKEHVKVLISGEGGDEAFAGYRNYGKILWLEKLKAAGEPWVTLAAATFQQLSRVRRFARARKYQALMRMPLQDYYYSLTSNPSAFFNRSRNELTTRDFQGRLDPDYSRRFIRQRFTSVGHLDLLSQMLYVDTKTWLPDDLLIKADKMTMANSVELRVPLLDHKVLEFGASLPSHLKVHNFTTKYILKRALGSRVPKQILNRKKMGFPVPIASWMRNELRAFVWEVLTDPRTRSRGYFEQRTIQNLLEKDAKTGGHEAELFSLLVLELWHRRFVDS